MQFLDCTKGRKDSSPSILDVEVEAALDRSDFDEDMFFKRGRQYKWTKESIFRSICFDFDKIRSIYSKIFMNLSLQKNFVIYHFHVFDVFSVV